jgi:hypothetical protein
MMATQIPNFSIDDVTLVPLTKGYIAVIDTSDAPAVLAHKWCAFNATPTRMTGAKIYGMTSEAMNNKKKIYLHRFILGASVGMEVDHCSGDTLDNRRSNLRIATKSQNRINTGPYRTNTTGYKGVSFRKRRNKFVASISVNRQTEHLGYFTTAVEAARAYDRAAIGAFGEFAWLNFPKEARS